MKATLSRAVEGWAVAPVRFEFSEWSKLPILLLLGLPLLVGCESRGEQEARREAAEAKATVAKLEVRLSGAIREIEDLQAELKAVRHTRDELQEQADAIRQEREQALMLAQEAKEVVANLAARADTTTSLEKRIAVLNAKVQEQNKTIEELEKKLAAQPVGAEIIEEIQDETLPVEPNAEP